MENKKHYFTLDCRSTGRGAYTTMNGERFDISRTGNHWRERLHVETGDEIEIIDVSNSGKHNCRLVRVERVEPSVEVKVIRYFNTDGFCELCG